MGKKTLCDWIEIFKHWASMYSNSCLKLEPEKIFEDIDEEDLDGFQPYNPGDILSYKMFTAFTLELLLKTYNLILLHKKEGNMAYTDDTEFYNWLDSEANLTIHDLNELLNKITEKENNFIKSADHPSHVKETIEHFDCFMTSRYPITKRPRKKDLLDWDGSFSEENKVLHTIEHFRRRINKYIRENCW